jgi:hypothetical protein
VCMLAKLKTLQYSKGFFLVKKHCVFLCYENVHKGYKCLEANIGHIYISREACFDETIFLFSKFHLNARAQLCSDILLLPPTLINPLIMEHGGDSNVADPQNNGLMYIIYDVNNYEGSSLDFV